MIQKISKSQIRNADTEQLLEMASEIMASKDVGHEVEELLGLIETNFHQLSDKVFPYEKKKCSHCNHRSIYKALKYSDLTVCEPCYDRLNDEFDEEYR